MNNVSPLIRRNGPPAAAPAPQPRRDHLLALEGQSPELLASLAHEMRAPLSAILCILQLQRQSGPSSASSRTMERQVHHLAQLADDLLALSQIAAGALPRRPAPLDLAGLVSEAAIVCAELLEPRGLSLAVDLPPRPLTLGGDASSLTLAVRRLITRAGADCHRGGEVAVELRCAAAMAQLSVEARNRGAEPIRSTPEPEGSRQGLDLGLELAERLIMLHEGKLIVQSRPGGTRYLAVLPLVSGRTGSAS